MADVTEDEYIARYTCPICERRYCVTALAAQCLARHERDTTPFAADITADTPADRIIRTR